MDMDMDALNSIGMGGDPVTFLPAVATTQRSADAMMAFPAGLSRRDVVYLSMAITRARAEGTAPPPVPAFVGQDRGAPTHREMDELKCAVFELQQQVIGLSEHVSILSQEVAKLAAAQAQRDQLDAVTAEFNAL